MLRKNTILASPPYIPSYNLLQLEALFYSKLPVKLRASNSSSLGKSKVYVICGH